MGSHRLCKGMFDGWRCALSRSRRRNIASRSLQGGEAGGAQCRDLRSSFRSIGLVAVSLAWSHVALGAAPCTENLTIDWNFHAAAPLADVPAVSRQGWVVVGSVDGYVHALGPGGRFQWSYTLDSPPSGIAVGADGRTYALSQEGVLHVLLPSGKHQWGSRLPAGMAPTGGMAHSERGTVFVPSNLNLYAFSASAGLSWRAFLGSPIVSGPVVTPEGEAWVATRDGRVVRIQSAQRRSQFLVPGSASIRLVWGSRTLVLALAREEDGNALVAYDPQGRERWRVSNVEHVSADGRLLQRRGTRGSVWTWINPTSGQVLGERTLELKSSAAPATMGPHAFVPTSAGRMYVFSERGDVEWCRIASAPLLEPHVDNESKQVTTASGDGWVASMRFRKTTPELGETKRPPERRAAP